MAARGFVANTGGAIALSAATAKTVLAVVPAANKSFTLVEVGIGFDGVSSAATPVLVELCVSSGATAGTSSAVTPVQSRGPYGATVTSSAAKTYTAEPTALTVIREWLVSPTSGIVLQFPLGREPEAIGITGASKGGIMVRCTAPAAVNVRATMEFEE